MSKTPSLKIACESCGARYRWSEKLAGKRVKCKCGQVLSFPKTPDAANPGKPEKSSKLKSQHDDSMFDSQGSYKLNIEEPKKVEIPKVKCKGCGAEVAGDAVVCVQCGVDPSTGKKFQPPKPKSDVESGSKIGQLIKVLLILVLLGATAWAVQNFWLTK